MCYTCIMLILHPPNPVGGNFKFISVFCSPQKWCCWLTTDLYLQTYNKISATALLVCATALLARRQRACHPSCLHGVSF